MDPEAHLGSEKLEKIRAYLIAHREEFEIIQWKKNSVKVAWHLTEFVRETIEVVVQLALYPTPDDIQQKKNTRGSLPKKSIGVS